MFPCSYCSQGPFDTAIDLSLHQREFHSGNKSVVAMDVANAGSIGPASHAASQQPGAETVKPLRGKLHDDFPGKSAFEAAGYDTYAKVRKVIASGEKVPGIADGITAKASEALEAKPESEDE